MTQANSGDHMNLLHMLSRTRKNSVPPPLKNQSIARNLQDQSLAFKLARMNQKVNDKAFADRKQSYDPTTSKQFALPSNAAMKNNLATSKTKKSSVSFAV